MIFSIEKYKAYQNVSLQLFDQESVIYEEEAITNDIRHTVVHQSEMIPQLAMMVNSNSRASAPSSIGGGIVKTTTTADFSIEQLFADLKAGRQAAAISFLKKYRLQDILFYRSPIVSTLEERFTLWEQNGEEWTAVEYGLEDLNLL